MGMKHKIMKRSRRQKNSNDTKKKYILLLVILLSLLLVIIITVVSFKSQEGYSCLDKQEEWANDTIVVITAKVWYVSDFNASIPRHANQLGKPISPQKRAETVLKNHIDYLNIALGNSRIPFRFISWGSVQDIGLKDSQITGTSDAVFERLLTRFDHIDDGRSRVYQTADMVILYLNSPMKSEVNPNQRVYGICNKRSNAILLKGQYGNGWLFAHEVGHCLGGGHLRPEYVMEGNVDSNFAYCPPDGNYGTIDSYPWECAKGPNGKHRVKAPYFSNPKVCHEGVPTGDAIITMLSSLRKTDLRLKNLEAIA